ncbi:MAG TPA: hypothetical protein PLS96_06405 [Myxococcota bacterium]|nr:hypothetical protein [Myxococcota bacterium]HQE73597.1 hypothetical protein [Myxococcota bacterium]HQI61575.1 hypothetical protein [Myxococcota bacterium]HRR73519.1 hypothetical protein [Myxococcota bacterium]HRV17440.1 hypothetical protein [Myxococcota bacterium]
MCKKTLPFVLVLLASCSTTLGSADEELPKEGVTAPIVCSSTNDQRPLIACPGMNRIEAKTAIETLTMTGEIAGAALGVEARWAGVIRGAGIGGDGRPSADNLAGYVAIWCDGEGELLFDTSGAACRIHNACGCVANETCRVSCPEAAAFPRLDAGEAIAVAYPDALENDVFQVEYDLRDAAGWKVKKSGDSDWILVPDAEPVP